MLGNFELLSLLLPEEVRDKLMLLDPDLTPEDQFNGFMELLKDETGLEIKFDKTKSLRENLQPLLDQMSITEKAKCNKILKFVETKIEERKNSQLIRKESEIDEGSIKRSKNINSTSNPDLLYFK